MRLDIISNSTGKIYLPFQHIICIPYVAGCCESISSVRLYFNCQKQLLHFICQFSNYLPIRHASCCGITDYKKSLCMRCFCSRFPCLSRSNAQIIYSHKDVLEMFCALWLSQMFFQFKIAFLVIPPHGSNIISETSIPSFHVADSQALFLVMMLGNEGYSLYQYFILPSALPVIDADQAFPVLPLKLEACLGQQYK